MRMLCKRALRHLVLFLLLLIAPILVTQISGMEAMPTAGFYMPQQDDISERIAERLLDNGFVSCSDPEELQHQVLTGELDCGAVFPEDFTQRIGKEDLEGSIRFYASPSSYTPELFRNHVAVAVYKEYVPYILMNAFVDTEVTDEMVLDEYDKMYDEGFAFAFDMQTVSGVALPEDPNARPMAIGTVAILMSTVLFALCAETADRTFRVMLGRLGLRKSLLAVLIPEILLNALSAAAFCGAGLALAGFTELVLPAVVYAFLVSGVGLLLASVPGRAKQVYVLLPVLVICAVALCPIYTDLSLLIPAVKGIRWVLPAYWLWPVAERPWLWAAVALGMLVLSVPVILLQFSVIRKYSLKKAE